MIDEKDVSMETQWYFEQRAQRAMKALKANNFDVDYVPDRREALARVLEMIPPGATIGCGDSVTLHQIGLIDWLQEQKDHEVFNPFFVESSDSPDSDLDEYTMKHFEVTQKALTANVFFTGTNAIILDGKLVNIDGGGNRVAPMIFGPNRVIVISGFNKIVKDVDEAIKRIHEYAAPINMKRHMKQGKTFVAEVPCTITGMCSNCRHKYKSCRITTIIDGWSPVRRRPGVYPPTIIIVGESLGI